MATATPDTETLKPPHAIDQHVGAQIRLRRRMLGVSQERLADSLGLTFQQVQKYERGHNRVSASKLFQIAEALNTDVSHFFQGIDKSDAGGLGTGETDAFSEFLSCPEGLELVQLWPKIQQRARRKILGLVRVLAGDEDAA